MYGTLQLFRGAALSDLLYDICIWGTFPHKIESKRVYHASGPNPSQINTFMGTQIYFRAILWNARKSVLYRILGYDEYVSFRGRKWNMTMNVVGLLGWP